MRSLLAVVFSALFLPLAAGVEVVGPPTVEVSHAQAVIHWRTDVSAGTRVQISPPATLQPGDKTPDTEHTATFTALKPGVKYTVVVGTARVWLATNEFTTTGTAPPTTVPTTKPVSPANA